MAEVGLEWLHLFALEFEKLLYLTVYTLASTIINQSAPNLVKRYRALRSHVSSIMGVIRPKLLELFALWIQKIAIFHFVNTVASTNINHLVPKLVKIYTTLKFSYEFD